jgi:predicted MFS family arabinose efflux permease
MSASLPPVRASAAARPAARAAPHEIALLLTLAAMQFTHVVDFMIMMPLGPQFMRLFEIDPQLFGFLVSAYTFAAAASGFIAAFRIDRYGRKRALLVMYSGFVVATALCGLAPTYPLLLAARGLAGLFGGVVGALVITIVADVVPYARRARGTALVASAFSLAAVMGVPLGLWFANHYSWRAPFLVLAGVSVAVGAIASRLLPALDAHVARGASLAPLAQMRAIFGVSNHLRAFAFMIALMMSVFTVVPFIAPYNVLNVGVAELDLPIIYFAGGLTTLFTAQLIGWLADRFGKRRIFIVLALASLVPLFTLTHLPRSTLAVAVGVAIVFFVFVSGRFGPATALVTGSVEPRLRGSFMSFSASVQQLASAFASLFAGLVVGRAADGTLTRYGWVGLVAMACTLIAIALALRIHVIPDGSGQVE